MTDSNRKLVFGQPTGRASASPRVRAVNREQMLMLQIDVERLIPEDHAARAIWELSGKLELKAFYEQVKAVEGRAGQPRFDPRLMISIWVYGLSRGINSARELSEWCRWEPGLQWLCAMGLGLSIARKSALLSGGDILLIAGELGGAGFRVVLPTGTNHAIAANSGR